MTTVGDVEEEGRIVSMKGAPEVAKLLHRPSAPLEQGLSQTRTKAILAEADEMAGNALRVLALAWKPISINDPVEVDCIESGLIFAGLTGMMDPPRKEVPEAIRISKIAGIRTVMITGDHRLTARAIGNELGIGNGEVIEGVQLDRMSSEELCEHIDDVSIFARVTAEHKVRIVEALKGRGHIVAMTGDGVNDAPACRRCRYRRGHGKDGHRGHQRGIGYGHCR